MDPARPAAQGAVPAAAMVAPAIVDRRMPGAADQRMAVAGTTAVAATAVDRAAVAVVAAAVACPSVAFPVDSFPAAAFPAAAFPAVALQAVALQAVVRKFAYYRIETGDSRSAQTPLSR